jgi:hypothetical protein
VSQIVPKLFTGFSGEEVVKKKDFCFADRPALSLSFLDRTVEAQRPEKHR